MWRRIKTITLNTFRESVRDRILWVAALFAAGFIFFSIFLGSISLEQDKKIIADLGLASIFLLQIFISIFVGANLMHKEMERRTFFMILPKPVTPSEILMGKWLGLGLTNLAMTFITSLIFSGVLLFKFGSVGGLAALAIAILLGLAEAFLIILLSLVFSSFTSPILAAIYTSAIFLIGHSSGILWSVIQKAQNVWVKYFLLFFYYILPNLEKFNLRSEAVYGIIPSGNYLVFTFIYAVFYGTFLFLVARIIFSKREY